jgi:hypothetical protein
LREIEVELGFGYGCNPDCRMGKSGLATAYKYEATTEPAREASVCELEGALHTP